MGGAFMIDTQNFIVRSSGKVDGRYYIDYIGLYKAADIAKTAGIELKKLRGIYLSNGGALDGSQDIYYFESMINAQKTISEIFSVMKKADKGRAVMLTEAEIDYIRNALINEAGFAGIDNRLKDTIFRKLNG